MAQPVFHARGESRSIHLMRGLEMGTSLGEVEKRALVVYNVR